MDICLFLFPVSNTPGSWAFELAQRLTLLTMLVSRLPVSNPTTPLAPGLLVNRPEVVGLLGSRARIASSALFTSVSMKISFQSEMARWRP